MYSDAEQMHLLDQIDYNQYSIALDEVEEERPYVTEALEGMLALIYNNECVGIQLPVAVELTVTHCDPAIKGDSATKRTKPATLETGLIVQVPDYLTPGERIKVDTRSGEFLSRVARHAAWRGSVERTSATGSAVPLEEPGEAIGRVIWRFALPGSQALGLLQNHACLPGAQLSHRSRCPATNSSSVSSG